MLRSSRPERYSASKWLKVPVLLEGDELEALLHEIGGAFYLTSGVVERGEVSVVEFLESYRRYIAGLKRGEIPDREATRTLFSSVWSTTPDALYTQPVGGRTLIRISLPVIQLRPHFIHYSPLDGQIRSMSPGISWGLEFSYPTLLQRGSAIEKVDDRFPNTAPFKTLQRWVRHHTLPVPFVIDGKRKNVPIRLGKGCFSWIGGHPELGALEVAV
ncbi:MAG: hypothetical protein AB7F31_04140 [Parachlamydiales bacterium]